MKLSLGRAKSPESLEGLLSPGSGALRRRLVVLGTLAVLVLAGISIAVAWRQYVDARQRAVNDLEARVVAVSGIVDASFRGQIATLQAIAKAPSVVNAETPRMKAYFARVNAKGSGTFSGGIGWIDRAGMVRASSSPGPALDLSRRIYFRRVLATRGPYVSAGLIGKRGRRPIVVVAVPTRDAKGRLSGVLAGSILLQTVAESQQALDLGYGDLEIVDRDGRLLLQSLKPVANTALLGRIGQARAGEGIVPRTAGLDGHGDHVVAFATSRVPGWVSVIDRPRSSVFAAARHALILELASVLAGLLLLVGVVVLVVRRTRRESEIHNRRARSWNDLTRALAAAQGPSQVSDALTASLARAFTDSVAVVALEREQGVDVKGETSVRHARRLAASTSALETLAPLGKDGSATHFLDQETSLVEAYELSGRRLTAVHSLPIRDAAGRAIGTIALVYPEPRLESGDWALLNSFAVQAAEALERARLFAHEHDLAVRLQRSLLPEELPSAEGVGLAGHYLAGAAAVEVGGDWYDAVRRPDGIIQLCVGDVTGKGIGAATVMGRQRNVFQVYAHDHTSPAEITRRMLRHVGRDEMITLACVSLDPYAGELAYSCAGHPPPLLLNRETGRVTRLDQASAPPVGVAEPGDVLEARLPLPEQSLLALYTDGLIERRGQNIEDGIAYLARLITTMRNATPERIVRRIGESLGKPDDDVALLLVTADLAGTVFRLEFPADPTALPDLRRRLRAWLENRRFASREIADIILAVSEACNNAIEHAYRDHEGTVTLRVEESRRSLSAAIEDRGTWREATSGDERGRGVPLMKHLMQAEIETDAGGTRVTLRLDAPDERALETAAVEGS